MKRTRRKIVRKADQTVIDSCINLPKTSLSKNKRYNISSEYLDIARRTLLAGYEWKFPLLGTVRIVRTEKTPKGTRLRCRHVLIGHLWYKLDITPDRKFDNLSFSYTISESLCNQMKELLSSKKVEYRYQS